MAYVPIKPGTNLTIGGDGTIGQTVSVNTYTASGAIAPTDTLSIINSSSNLAMTLAAGSGSAVIQIKRYGTGTVSVTASIDGTAGQVVNMTDAGGKDSMRLTWNAGLSTWILG